jgi:NhaP-type Na+/H+ or K+/H+ antiporter
MHGAAVLLLILCAGLASQWLAWRLGLPSIVVLVAAGLAMGPGTGLIHLTLPGDTLAEFIGLGVAVILFEGGMDLKLAEFRRAASGVRRLTVAGPPVAWLLGSTAAHYVAGLSWPVSLVLGAVLVVTGPTVIGPLMRQARLNKDSATLLKWEGIVNDPLGVLLAVLTFQYFAAGGGNLSGTLGHLVAALLAAVLLGGAGGWVTGRLYRMGQVPEHLKAPMLMVLVLVVYWCGNLVQHEAGLLAVTIMGMVIGNMDLPDREALRHFQENLAVVLLSVLFIVIPSQLEAAQLALLGLPSVLFVLLLLVLVRPLSVALATAGARVRREDRLLLAWIAPRGIVAAATAGVFGPAMVAAGYDDAQLLLPIVFLVILVTVLAHGFTIGPLARRLGLSARAANGLLVVGATPFTCALATKLKAMDVDVLVADGAWPQLRSLRMEGVDTFYGEVLSEHAEHDLETQHLSYALAATDNDFYNAMVCKRLAARFGVHRVYQLDTTHEGGAERKSMALQTRGHLAFDGRSDAAALEQRLDQGWVVQTSRLTESRDWTALTTPLGERGKDWVLIGGVNLDGRFLLHGEDHPIKPGEGWRIVYFAPEGHRAGA